MTQPRVLFLTSSYPTPEEPALGIFVLELARAVSTHVEVAVVHLERRRDVRWVSVHRDEKAELPTWHVRYPYRPTGLSIVLHVLAGIAGYRAVRRAGFKPQLLHAHFFTAALPAALISALSGTPFVETEHWTIFLPEDPAVLTAPLRLGARLALRNACSIMPVSEALARAMAAAGIRGPFRVIPNVVDTSLFKPGAKGGGGRLVMVGALNPQKGADVLLRAFARVRVARPDATLDIVGDGPERSAYERLRSDLGLDDAVVFHGVIPKKDVASILAASDLFVLASRYDTFGCVLAEAQSAGLPIVATRVGGIPEIVDGAGFLVERDDVEGLADQILRALDELRTFDPEALAQRARERYATVVVGSLVADVYADCLRAGAGT